MKASKDFWDFVEKTDGCWLWTGYIDRGGYGIYTIRPHRSKAHRFSYIQMVGQIPDGLQLDHLCRNRRCVNPNHLEPVTLKENVMRGVSPTAMNAKKTHCKYGHAFNGDNLRIRATGGRDCRTCKRETMRRIRAQRMLGKVAK